MSISVCSKCGKRNRVDVTKWRSGTTPICRMCGTTLSLPNSIAMGSTASAFETKSFKNQMLNFIRKPESDFMNSNLISIWIREASYRYRIIYFVMAFTLFVPKQSSLQIELLIEKSGWITTFLPISIQYLFAFFCAVGFFWAGHLAGYVLRRAILSDEEIDIYSRRFTFRYLVSFSLIPMFLLIFLQTLIVFVLREDPVGFLEFVIRLFIFIVGSLAIVFIFGFLSLRALRGFAKRHMDITLTKDRGFK